MDFTSSVRAFNGINDALASYGRLAKAIAPGTSDDDLYIDGCALRRADLSSPCVSCIVVTPDTTWTLHLGYAGQVCTTDVYAGAEAKGHEVLAIAMFYHLDNRKVELTWHVPNEVAA